MSSSANDIGEGNHIKPGPGLSLIKTIRRTLRDRRKQAQWRRELYVLSDRTLRDIGVIR